MITGVAIKSPTQVWMLPAPKRHHHLAAWVNDGAYFATCEQGFVTDTGEFLCRAEAAEHALNCGQIRELMTPPWLFSEDMRRVSNGDQYVMVVAAAMAHPVSRVWKGYWQRTTH